MTFIEATVEQIDQAIAERRADLERLEAALKALTTVPSSDNGRARVSPASSSRSARMGQALALIEAKPGITGGEVGQAMGAGTYGYTLVKRLKEAGQIEKCGTGWQVK